jgi:hypothetical protein
MMVNALGLPPVGELIDPHTRRNRVLFGHALSTPLPLARPGSALSLCPGARLLAGHLRRRNRVIGEAGIGRRMVRVGGDWLGFELRHEHFFAGG